MQSFIAYHLTQLWYICATPFIYWFGNNWLFMELWALSQDLVDLIGFYWILIFAVIFVIATRNTLFQGLTKIFHKKNFRSLNLLPLFVHFKTFFSSFKLFVLTLKNKIKK